MYEIKEIKIWPFARSLGIISMAITAIAEVCFVIFLLIIDEMSFVAFLDDISSEPRILLTFFSFIIGSGVASLIGGALGSWAYNLLSSKIGGIKIDIVYLEEDK